VAEEYRSRTAYVPPKNIEQVLRRSDAARDLMATLGAQVLSAAKGHGAQVRRSGHYAESFGIQIRLLSRGWEARVLNTDFKAGWIEFGSVNNAKHRVLGRALDAARQ
jgi:hypothetical protein